jgi:hypothetical protein
MTIINNIEIDNITYKVNDLKYAISNNDPIEEKLNVIIVISNPCLYAKRYILCKEFIKRIEEQEENVNLFITELAYNKQKFIITNKNNKKHLQIRTNNILWHKENMVNLAVKSLLPVNYKLIKHLIIKKLIIRNNPLEINKKWHDCYSRYYKYKYKSVIKHTKYNLDILYDYLLPPLIDIIKEFLSNITYTFCFEEHPDKYDDVLVGNYLYVVPSKRKNTFFVNKDSCFNGDRIVQKKLILDTLYNF